MIDEINTRDDLIGILKTIGAGRYRIIEIRPAAGLIVFVRPQKQSIVYTAIRERLPDNVGLFVGTLRWTDCWFRRRDWHIIGEPVVRDI